jgi:hypothetical protein
VSESWKENSEANICEEEDGILHRLVCSRCRQVPAGNVFIASDNSSASVIFCLRSYNIARADQRPLW